MILRQWKFWAVLLAAATCIGLLEGAQIYAARQPSLDPITWLEAFVSTMPSWYIIVALLPGILWIARRFPLEASRWRAPLAVHLVAAVTFAFLHIILTSSLTYFVLSRLLLPPGSVTTDFRTSLSGVLGLYFVVELLTYFAFVAAHHAYDYARRLHDRDKTAALLALKTSRLEASLANAHLDSLRAQLNPHFLFNTLNAISVLAMKGEKHSVMRMLTLLSDLLRLSLDQQQQVVALREELEFLDRYLEIERVRFKDRLTVERDIDVEALDAEVPALLLQPLVENAIKHGISRQVGPGMVRVEAEIVDGDTLQVRVLDTGPGFGQRAPRDREGVGTANTRARLEQMYGSDQSLELCNRPEGGACVTVRLPLRIVTGELLNRPLRSASA